MSDEPVMTPIGPDEGGSSVPPKLSPFGETKSDPAAAPAAASAPAAPAAATAGTATIKLKPVIRKPMIHKPVIGGAKPLPSAPAAAATAAKKATQNLKSVTGPIPAQATLRKTGIIAEGIITPQQQQAAKSKTSRISLESAIGVAPVKETPAPLKTIRLRRPTDLKMPGAAPVTAPAPAEASVAPAPAPAPEPVAEAPAPAAAEADAGVTQKKTLKLHRPGGIGIKRPTLGVGAKPAGAPTAEAAAPASMDEVKDLPVGSGSVPEMKPFPAAGFGVQTSDSGTVAGVPGWVAALSLITSLAALVAAGLLVWYLWQEGVGPVAGANEMQFIQM